jgi:hypothetical protein
MAICGTSAFAVAIGAKRTSLLAARRVAHGQTADHVINNWMPQAPSVGFWLAGTGRLRQATELPVSEEIAKATTDQPNNSGSYQGSDRDKGPILAHIVEAVADCQHEDQ